MNNIIILTHGWTASSVFAALLGEAGYWIGADTHRTLYYNTFENADLVSFNEVLLRSLAPTLNHEHHFDAENVTEIERRARGLDLRAYRSFVAQCTNKARGCGRVHGAEAVLVYVTNYGERDGRARQQVSGA